MKNNIKMIYLGYFLLNKSGTKTRDRIINDLET